MAEEDKQDSIFRQPETKLEEAGFNQLLVREEDFFSPPIEELGSKSTPLTPNPLNNQITGQNLLDATIPDSKIVTAHKFVTESAITLDRGYTVLSCDTTDNAVAITLPSARRFLGKQYIIFFNVDGGSDVTVSTSDTFQGAAGAGNDLATGADANDYLHIVATSNAVWLVLSQTGFAFS